MGSNITAYFSVSKYGDYTYLHEKFTNPNKAKENQARLIDIMLQNQQPKEVGVYAAIIQHVQTAEDDFRLDVISCTPVYTFGGVEIVGGSSGEV